MGYIKIDPRPLRGDTVRELTERIARAGTIEPDPLFPDDGGAAFVTAQRESKADSEGLRVAASAVLELIPKLHPSPERKRGEFQG